FLLISFVYYLQTKPRIIRMFILLFVASVIFVYHEILFSILSSIYDVVIYRFKENDNFFNFILSGRDNYVREAFSEFFKSNFWEVKLILGGGAFMSFRSEYVSGMIFDTLEMDFFDVLFMYGLIGALLYLSVIIYLIISSYRISRKLSFLFIFLFLHSFFAGHVFFDGLPVIAGVILYLMTKHINTVKSKFCI
ncbi:MAG TPA: O-antigen ligase family protein, partial [Candidatus Bacteroides avicola]|nr:O-antigen ligase family protein [Candidatus Bacteroides avicola]